MLKVTENNTSAGCIRFNAILCIMFQRVFSVLLFIYHILNCYIQCQYVEICLCLFWLLNKYWLI